MPRRRLDRRTAIRHLPGRERSATFERRPDHFFSGAQVNIITPASFGAYGMPCVWLFLGCLRHMFCRYKTFLVMKSNEQVGALPFQYVKTHVASECLG